MKWVPLLIIAEFSTADELLEHCRVEPAQRGALRQTLTEAGACHIRWQGLPLVLAVTAGCAVACAPAFEHARDTIDRAWANDPQMLAIQFDELASAMAPAASSAHSAI
jgi:hypothetical protein